MTEQKDSLCVDCGCNLDHAEKEIQRIQKALIEVLNKEQDPRLSYTAISRLLIGHSMRSGFDLSEFLRIILLDWEDVSTLMDECDDEQ